MSASEQANACTMGGSPMDGGLPYGKVQDMATNCKGLPLPCEQPRPWK